MQRFIQTVGFSHEFLARDMPTETLPGVSDSSHHVDTDRHDDVPCVGGLFPKLALSCLFLLIALIPGNKKSSNYRNY